MTKFPDSVFSVAGTVPMSRGEFQTNVVVFESLENERRYFTQRVIGDTIAGFEIYQSPFEGTSEFRDRHAKVGDQAIYCFTTPSGKFLGAKSEIAPKIAEQVAQRIYSGENKVEAALFAGDTLALQNALDERFHELATNSPASANFFRHNNILRPLIISDLSDGRLAEIAKNAKIEVSERSKAVRLRFPTGVRQEEALAISSSARRQMKRSRAFDGLEIDDSAAEHLLRMSVADYRNYVRLDLSYSKDFIESTVGKALFVPAGGWRENIFDEIFDPDNGPDSDSGYKTALASILAFKPVGLNQAIMLAAMCMLTARVRGLERWWEFGGVRCCALSIRKDVLKFLGTDTNLQRVIQPDDLFCVNAAIALFERSKFSKSATLDSFVKKELKGVVHKKNFGDFEFGVDKYSDFMLTSTHRL